MPGFFYAQKIQKFRRKKKTCYPPVTSFLIIPIIMLKPTSGLEQLDIDNL